jgi:protein-L-isoaspartate(D-aspartate) O-methyltransferase
MHDFAAYRRNMIESQIRTNQVTDGAVLTVFSEIPRETFVPAQLAGVAYIDESVPLGSGRFLVEPMVSARLTQALEVKATDKVLVVGAASGYMAAILSRLAGKVVALESDATLAAQASKNLRALGADNASVELGALPNGHTLGAPYDIILCDGALAQVPDALREQLKEGGRLAAVMTRADGTAGQGVIMLKTNGTLSKRVLFDAVTPLLPGCGPQPAFVF